MNTNMFAVRAVIGPAWRLLPPGSEAVEAVSRAPVVVQRTTSSEPLLARAVAAVATLGDRFWDVLENGERNRREQWLAESADIYELERRLEALERRSSGSAF